MHYSQSKQIDAVHKLQWVSRSLSGQGQMAPDSVHLLEFTITHIFLSSEVNF